MSRATYPPPADVHERTALLRGRFVDAVTALDPKQWSAATLCEGWDVHTLTAHLLMTRRVTFLQFVMRALRHRGDSDKAVDDLTRRIARMPTEDVLRELRADLNARRTPPRVGAMGPYADICVHLRDLARPLGLDVDADLSDWRHILGYLATPKANDAMAPAGRLDGLSFTATDQDWRAGNGAELSGPSEALALAMSGRGAALADLDGPGVGILTTRLGATDHPR